MPSFFAKALNGLISQAPSDAGEARGTLSGYTLGVNPLWGQPYPEAVAGDASGLISRERMREIVLRTPTTAACMNAILDFTGGVTIGVRNVDPSKPVPKYQQKRLLDVLKRPNPSQTRRQFLLALVRDLVTFGYAAVEVVKTGKAMRPVHLFVMDSARLRVDFDEHGTIQGYDMLNARGVPILSKEDAAQEAAQDSMYSAPHGAWMGASSGQVPVAGSAGDLHGWEPEEVIFFQLNPQSESAYPYSRIVQLFTSAVLEDLMLQFVADRFTDSNIPFGIFDLGQVTEVELKQAIDNWNSQAKQPGNRILLTGSKGAGSKWTPFGYHLKDLEAVHLLQELRMKIMGILGVTMNELGEEQDASKAGGYNLSFTFKKRAIEPVLMEVTETLSVRLIDEIFGYTDAEYYFEEIDSRDDFLQSQIDTNYMKLGVLKPNEIRNRRGDINVPGGEDAMLFTGSSWMPTDLAREMAELLIHIAAQTTALSAPGIEGTRVREDIQQQQEPLSSGGSGAGTPVNQNGHKQGANASMTRHLMGRNR